MSRVEGDTGSLRYHFGLLEYVPPAPPPIPTTPSVYHPMPCLHLEDCDNPTNEDDEDAADNDRA